LISEETTESSFEHSIRISKDAVVNKLSIPGHMMCAERKYIQVFTCGKCGKLKRFVEKI